MALAKTVTKMWPDENWVGLNLVVTDDNRPDLGSGAQVVISATVKRQFVTGEDMPNSVRDELGNEAQALIDKYKGQRALYDNATYTTKIAQIDGALTL